MVPLPQVIASNERIAPTFPHGLVAVFVGGTSGVGEYTLKAFAKYSSKPRVYFIGRSQEAADRIIAECKELNPGGYFEFIKADVSLLKNVDDVCRQIKAKETTINILFQSQGSMGFEATTSEGLPLAAGLIMHSRTRFIINLLPLLQKASFLRRVVSVLAATCEGPIDTGNIPGKGFALIKWRNQAASVQTLLLEEAARRAPDVSFVHDAPGVVKGGISRDAQGIRMAITLAISSLLRPLIETPPAECGQYHLFFATSARFTPREGAVDATGVPLEEGLDVAKGSDGQAGSGIYTIDNRGESAPPKVYQLLAEMRENGTAEKVWDYVSADFKRITGTEFAL
ncbi:putative Short-chain dehydrogenases/reductase [Pleurostoma richardsiae]|uniref:Short-chain dehydrogenases/reductase n=1 Tax=Pleurostoma richardsiae TaxID=41990 RepID=A0AA38S4P2_9PEZI|nr:putative Short-chain dehydrogenases/reductase [Pleurostoma richardsiae]